HEPQGRIRGAGNLGALKKPLITERTGAFGGNSQHHRTACSNDLVTRLAHDDGRSSRQTGSKGSLRKSDALIESSELRLVIIMEIPTVERNRDSDPGHI